MAVMCYVHINMNSLDNVLVSKDFGVEFMACSASRVKYLYTKTNTRNIPAPKAPSKVRPPREHPSADSSSRSRRHHSTHSQSNCDRYCASWRRNNLIGGHGGCQADCAAAHRRIRSWCSSTAPRGRRNSSPRLELSAVPLALAWEGSWTRELARPLAVVHDQKAKQLEFDRYSQ